MDIKVLVVELNIYCVRFIARNINVKSFQGQEQGTDVCVYMYVCMCICTCVFVCGCSSNINYSNYNSFRGGGGVRAWPATCVSVEDQ